MIAVDHVRVPARDAAAMARFLSEILGLPPAAPDGPEGEVYWLHIGESGGLLIVPGSGAAQEHVAFRVDPVTFNGVVNRLRAKGVAFGNNHEDNTNRQTADLIGGGHGRVYFLDPNGHLFEVVA